jgi:HEAT repeat protein
MDATATHPELMPVAIHALGMLGDPRSRFFLREQLLEGESRFRLLAARALANAGPEGLALLREAVRSAAGEPRRAAVEALLPIATTDDLTVLYQYVDRPEAGETGLAERARQRALELEAELERRLDAESASAPTR